jgi:predicted regulator of Ras-like GTPase activity (Roadblock/LC7/MglB family)
MNAPRPDTIDAAQIQWLLSRFASGTEGVTDTVAIASDGRLLATSDALTRTDADRLATVTAAFANLARGAGTGFELGEPVHVVVDLEGGFLVIKTINANCVLGILANAEADLDELAYDVTTFTKQVGGAITAAVVAELAAAIADNVTEQ